MEKESSLLSHQIVPENSVTIDHNMKKLMDEMKSHHILIINGYIRKIALSSNIPAGIINYCMLYTFLEKYQKWCNEYGYWRLSNDDSIASVSEYVFPNSNWYALFANTVVDKGKYQWKLRTLPYYHLLGNDEQNLFVRIGLTTKLVTNDKWYNMTEEIMEEMVNYSWNINVSPFYKPGHFVTICLDLDKRQISFWNNDEFIGVALENVKRGKYRLAVCVKGGRYTHRIELL